MKELTPANLLGEFIKKVLISISDEEGSSLYVKRTDLLSGQNPLANLNSQICEIDDPLPKTPDYNLIFGELSFKRIDLFIKNLIEISKLLEEIDLAFFIGPTFQETFRKHNLDEKLLEHNLYVNALYRFPKDFLNPHFMKRLC